MTTRNMMRKKMEGSPLRLCAGMIALSAAVVVAPNFTHADQSNWSAARIWNEQLLDSIRKDFARPPIHARNLYHVSAAKFDAWAVYDANAIGVFSNEKVDTSGMSAAEIKQAQEVAISYAAFRMIKHRFPLAPGWPTIHADITQQMFDLGLDPDDETLVGDSPVAVGNRCAAAVIEHGFLDAANEANNYAPINPHTMGPYAPLNDPLVVEMAGAPTIVEPNHWTEIFLNVVIDQQDNVLSGNTVPFIGPHWGLVDAFALRDEHKTPGKVGVYLDPGEPPMLGASELDTQEWIRTFAYVVWTNTVLSPDYDGSTPPWPWDGVATTVKAGETMPELINLSPSSWGNNPLGETTQPGHGPINPVTGELYEENWTKYGDYARIVAEFWADGPMSSTPPGHWNEIANQFLLDNPDFERRMKGTGPVLDDLEWDVKMYLAINGGAHDAAVATWGVKGYYDWTRPIFAIRYMAELGQSSDPDHPTGNYHPHGLPLIDGVIEVITEDEIQPGGKFYHLREMVVDENGFPVLDENFQFMWDATQFIGELAVLNWPGSPWDPVSLPWIWVHPTAIDLGAPYSGVRWIRAKRWSTYQMATFITPPFAGYTSGHTTFSRVIAEVLTKLTGSPYFPGGFAEYVIPQDWLHFEEGPSQEVRLQWASYFDCSDQSARSRIYGSIHPPVDDIPARHQGSIIGPIVAEQAFYHFGVAAEELPAGCSQGFWKNNFDQWPAAYSPDDNFDAVFGTSIFGAKTLGEVINMSSGANSGPGSPHAKNLAKVGVVALLNAASSSDFPLSTADVITQVADALNSGSAAQMIAAKTSLHPINAQGCVALPEADLNQDASVDGFDLLIMLGDWGKSGPADLNRDGVVNGFDMLLLLGEWGPAQPKWSPLN